MKEIQLCFFRGVVSFFFFFYVAIPIFCQEDSILYMNIPQITIIPLPSDPVAHPYLFFDSTFADHVNPILENPEFIDLWNTLKKDALNPEKYKFDYIRAVLPGCFVYNITKDTSFGYPAIRIIEELLANPEHRWAKPSPFNPELKYMNWPIGEKVFALAFAYDMLHELLTEDMKERIKEALRIKVFSYYLAATSKHDTVSGKFYDEQGHYDWWTNCYFSWNSRINGSIGLAAMATLWEIPEANIVLKRVRSSIQYTHAEFNQPDESGGYDAGSMALGKHLADLIKFYVALERLYKTDDGFFSLPGIPKSMQFYMDMVGPDQKFIPLAFNAHREVFDPPSELHYLADRYNKKVFHHFLDVQSHPDHQRPFALLWRPLLNDTILPGARETSKIYKDIAWGFINDKRFLLPFRCGDNAANHSQLDAGNILLYLNETDFITSPGPGYDQTEYQNCVVINNKSQLRGDPRKRVNGAHSDVFAPVEYLQSPQSVHFINMNLKNMYDSIEHYKRHLVVTQSGNVLVIDQISATNPSTFQLNWQTTQEVQIESDSLINLKSSFRGVRMNVAANLAFHSQLKDQRTFHTITISNKQKTNNIFIATMFTPFAIRNPELELLNTESGYQIIVRVKNNEEAFNINSQGNISNLNQ